MSRLKTVYESFQKILICWKDDKSQKENEVRQIVREEIERYLRTIRPIENTLPVHEENDDFVNIQPSLPD